MKEGFREYISRSQKMVPVILPTQSFAVRRKDRDWFDRYRHLSRKLLDGKTTVAEFTEAATSLTDHYVGKIKIKV